MKKILVIHGPNLNLLGNREPDVYGRITISEVNKKLKSIAKKKGIELDVFQSNHEGEIVDKIGKGKFIYAALLINPAAYTHTSVAIRDALLATKIPFIEVHLSNVHAREPFRKHSYFSDIAEGVICGLGAIGYELALQAAHQILLERK